MLKTLITIWFKQKRRSFKWLTLFMTLYFYTIFIGSFVFGLIESGITYGELKEINWIAIVPVILVSIMGFDIISKLLFKRGKATMDAFLKTRPVDKSSWGKFIVVENLFENWNIFWAAPMSIAAFILMPLHQALMAATLIMLFSLANGIAVTAFYTAKGWEYKMAVVTGWIFWAVVSSLHSFNFFNLPWAVHVGLFILMCLFSIWITVYYICKLKVYVEQKQEEKHSTKVGTRSLYAMEYRAFFRSKRLRFFAFFVLFMIFNAYLQTSNDIDEIGPFMHYYGVPFAVLFASAIYLQFTFAIEGNFFDGLWSRPVPVREILVRKFNFSGLLTLLSGLLVLPVCWMNDIELLFVLSTIVLGIGFANPILLLFALTTKRIDLFTSGFMNYQGNDFSLNSFAVTLTVLGGPMLILGFCPMNITILLYFILGGLGLAAHRLIINKISELYINNRYKHFERYRS